MRIGRVFAVTAGLTLAGAVFGTLAGAITLFAWEMSIDGTYSLVENTLFALCFGAWIGGTLGAVLGPIAAWLLMRQVPLGLAVGGTMLGTLASGGIGLATTADPAGAMLWGLAGFTVSAIGLRIRFSRGGRRLPAH